MPQVLWSHLITTILRVWNPFYRWGHWGYAHSCIADERNSQNSNQIPCSYFQESKGLRTVRGQNMLEDPRAWWDQVILLDAVLWYNQSSTIGRGLIATSGRDLSKSQRPCLGLPIWKISICISAMYFFLENTAKIRWAKTYQNISTSINNLCH